MTKNEFLLALAIRIMEARPDCEALEDHEIIGESNFEEELTRHYGFKISDEASEDCDNNLTKAREQVFSDVFALLKNLKQVASLPQPGSKEAVSKHIGVLKDELY